MLSKLSIGQVEREITNQVRSFYTSELGIRCGQIICHFFDTKLIITVENTISPIEKYFCQQDEYLFVEEIHSRLDRTIKSRIQAIVEKTLGKSVIYVIIATTIDIGVTSITVLLQEVPQVRNPESIPKVKIQALEGAKFDI